MERCYCGQLLFGLDGAFAANDSIIDYKLLSIQALSFQLRSGSYIQVCYNCRKIEEQVYLTRLNAARIV